MQMGTDIVVMSGWHVIGNQQNPAPAGSPLFQQLHSALDSKVSPISLGRHDGRFQHVEHGFNGAAIFGQGCHHVGIARIHQQSGQASVPDRQNVPDLAFGQGQPVRLNICCQH
jgi:hypothetical protein